jgi:hypothetical protein
MGGGGVGGVWIREDWASKKEEKSRRVEEKKGEMKNDQYGVEVGRNRSIESARATLDTVVTPSSALCSHLLPPRID